MRLIPMIALLAVACGGSSLGDDCDALWAERESAQAAAEAAADAAEQPISDGGSTITEAEVEEIRTEQDRIAAATDDLEAAGCL